MRAMIANGQKGTMPTTMRATTRSAAWKTQETGEASGDEQDGPTREEAPVETNQQSLEDVVTTPTRRSTNALKPAYAEDAMVATEDPGRCTLAKGHGTSEGTAAIFTSIYDASAASAMPRTSTKVIDRKDVLASESIHGYGNGEDKIGYWNTRDEVETTEGPSKEGTLAEGHGTSEDIATIFTSIYDAFADPDKPRPSTKVIDRVVWNEVGLCVYDG